MEIQLQELIDQIKKDGVEAADAEAKSIVEKAKADAEKIISDAKAKADKILADAKVENERMVRTSEDAIRQAGRNLLISFRESVTRELSAVVGEKVCAAYSSDDFTKLIVNVVECWAKNAEANDLSVILNEKDLKSLEEKLLSALKERLLSGVTLKSSDNFDGGFRIAVNNGSAYYDYSSEAVVDMLSSFLSPKVTELLKEAQ
jgi:V/A-type H+-transporting ATPase subunit E